MRSVLIVVSTLNTGGAQKAAAELSLILAEKYNVDILVNDECDKTFLHAGNVISLGFKSEKNKRKLLYQIRVLIKRVCFIAHASRKRRYKAVISFLDSANYSNIIGNIFSDTKTICSVHNTISKRNDKLYKYIVEPIDRVLYKYADYIISVSDGVKKDLIENVGVKNNNVTTIYNGFNLDDILNKSKEPLMNDHNLLFDDSFVISTMGRLCQQKGQWHLIRALRECVKSFPKLKLIILGEGEYREYLEELVRKCNLEQNIHFIGFDSNPNKYIAKSDLFVFPSLYEGFGNALVEAMSLGVPCVATDYECGAREILSPDVIDNKLPTESYYLGKYGVIIPPLDNAHYNAEDPETSEEHVLSQAIMCFVKDNNLKEKYSRAAQQGAERFNISCIARKWFDIID